MILKKFSYLLLILVCFTAACEREDTEDPVEKAIEEEKAKLVGQYRLKQIIAVRGGVAESLFSDITAPGLEGRLTLRAGGDWEMHIKGSASSTTWDGHDWEIGTTWTSSFITFYPGGIRLPYARYPEIDLVLEDVSSFFGESYPLIEDYENPSTYFKKSHFREIHWEKL